jgi:hypothetical protein
VYVLQKEVPTVGNPQRFLKSRESMAAPYLPIRPRIVPFPEVG